MQDPVVWLLLLLLTIMFKLESELSLLLWRSEVSARAMRILRRIAERQPEMFQTCLAAGLKATSALHERIRSNYHASSSASFAGMHPGLQRHDLCCHIKGACPCDSIAPCMHCACSYHFSQKALMLTPLNSDLQATS